MPRMGTRQLQLYMQIVLFYMTVVYLCMLHVKFAARTVAQNASASAHIVVANTTLTRLTTSEHLSLRV